MEILKKFLVTKSNGTLARSFKDIEIMVSTHSTSFGFHSGQRTYVDKDKVRKSIEEIKESGKPSFGNITLEFCDLVLAKLDATDWLDKKKVKDLYDFIENALVDSGAYILVYVNYLNTIAKSMN